MNVKAVAFAGSLVLVLGAVLVPGAMAPAVSDLSPESQSASSGWSGLEAAHSGGGHGSVRAAEVPGQEGLDDVYALLHSPVVRGLLALEPFRVSALGMVPSASDRTHSLPVEAGVATGIGAERRAMLAASLNTTLSADNSFQLYISTDDSATGGSAGSGTDWAVNYNLSASLTPGVINYIHIRAHNDGGPAGLGGVFSLSGSGFEFDNGTTALDTVEVELWGANNSGFGQAYQTPVLQTYDWGSGRIITGRAFWVGGATMYASARILPVAPEYDCNSNGVDDADDIFGGTSLDCQGNGVPDECELEGNDCNSNGVPDVCELQLPSKGLRGTDCNINGILDGCDLAEGTSEDCNENGWPDECDINYGGSEDCQPNGTPDECEVAIPSSKGLRAEDCNWNGVPDECDIAGVTSNDCQFNGIPDECELEGNDCNGNLVPDECDLPAASGGSADCNGNSIPDECELEGNDCNGNLVPDECDLPAASGGSADCNNNSVPDECDIAAGTSADDNENDVPDECELIDCNNNGIADDQDIAAGTSQDCNSNAVPDECDLPAASGGSSDCNGNSVPDECELEGNDCNGNSLPDECDLPAASGGSADCNGNSVPDECELEGNDCNSNGVPDECDLPGASGGSSDCNGNSVPDECELEGNDCNGNSLPDECDLPAASGGSADCNGNNTPDECELEGNDCNDSGVPDECELAGNDCNDTGVPDDCELEGNDCNGNSLPDECDLPAASGGSSDCNGNSVPDECELEGNDCNINGIPDECELAGNDCNANGVPDDCELTGNDCNGNGTPDDCELAQPPSHNCCSTGHGAGCDDAAISACVCAGDDYCCNGEWDADCVGLVESLGCGSCTLANDCNANGTLDECDIAESTSDDCNVNMIPDECDIAKGTSLDCNANGVPDSCDLSGGFSRDCNDNDIPDDCEVSTVSEIRVAQESAPGAGDFDSHVLGTIEVYETSLTADGYFRYDLGVGSSFNGPAPALTDDRSHLFLVGATDGLSLFVVHDKPDNPDGGSADSRYEFFGDPDGVWRSVEDDPDEGFTGAAGASVFTCDLGWSPCCTDGVVYTGIDGNWSVLVSFTAAVTGMDSWAVYSPGQGPIALSLQANRRVRLDLVFETGANDCNGNGVPDECDLTEGTSADCNTNGQPDECDVPPLGSGPDCDGSGVPDECELEGNDCNDDGIPDQCNLASNDCNANGVPDECETDCNTNGIPDDCDITGATSIDCNANGIPDECDVAGEDCNTNGIPDDCETDCNANGKPDDCDVAAGTSADCNASGVPDECELGVNDCNNNGYPDECDVATGTSPDCNTSGVPDECELAGNDCNGNSVPDECDLIGGTASDCNTNGIPDVCDLSGGTAPDCNVNLVPDECDVAVGTSLDCQPDGVPDECQMTGIEYSTDFESGVGSEWSSSATDNSVPNPFTRFSGRFGNTTQTLTAPVVSGLTYELRFDLMIIDSWDGNGPGGGSADWFNVYIDGVRVFHHTFSNFDHNNQTYTNTPDVGPASYGWSSNWGESIYRGILLEFTPAGSTVQIGFNGSGLQSLSDESWGIDNVSLVSGAGGDCNNNGTPDECDVSSGASPDCNGSGIPDECELAGRDCNTSGVPDECELEGNDCNENGTPDECDVVGLDCNGSGVPDECELEGNDCNENGVPDECDVIALDCNSNGVPDDCELGGNDCNNNGVPDDCDVVVLDCNSSGIPDDCELDGNDCNNNVTPDECDLVAGVSADCNSNSLPDECEVAAGSAADCNLNGIPDSCDVAGGASADCNHNEVPDECEMSWQAPVGDGLALWLQAGSVSSVGGGQPVANWPDGSGNGLDVSQASGGSQPIYVPNVLNGLPALRFDGDDYFTGADVIGSAISGLDEVTIYLVEKQAGVDPQNSTIGWGTSGNRVLLHTTWQDNLHFQHGDAEGGAGISAAQPAGWDDAFHLLEFWREGSPAEIIVDGDLLEAGEIGDTPEIGETHELRIGSDQFNNHLTGDICEILVYSRALSGAERLRVNNYLKHRYGLGELVGGLNNDCNTNGVLDECDVAEGTSLDCNGNVVPDECETDCNTNGVPDDCDIAAGTSVDCNNNDVPDLCDLPGNDCNTNGIPDDCDIASGASTDGNTNGLPDECEGPPAITEQVPGGVVYVPFSAVEVVFSDSIDGTTFGADDVLLVGPAGVIVVDPPVEEAGNRWRISFAELVDEGYYDLTVGPDVVSMAGHAMTAAHEGQVCLVIAGSGDGAPVPMRVVELQPTVSHEPSLDSAEVTFDRTIDAGSFTVDDVLLIAPDGAVEVDSVTPLAGDAFEVAWVAQIEEGSYSLRVGPNISDVCGQLMDQDEDGSAGEIPDDVFVGTIMLDTSPPEVVAHNPVGVVHVPLSFIDVTFDETIDGGTFDSSDVSLTGPEGPITVNSVAAQSGRVYRLGFAEQSANGAYDFAVGPDILDQAGTAMVAAYQASVTVALPDLAVTQITSPAQGGTGQQISVDWTVTNVGDFDALGSWTDKVYLSDDAVVGGDIALGTFTQSGPLATTGAYARTELVTLPTDSLGTFWIVVETNSNHAVSEAGTISNNAMVALSGVSVVDATAPETMITSGPAAGSAISTDVVSFGWTGSDNATAPAVLEYGYCLAPEATGCDPSAGPFSTEVTAEFTGLTEENSPYVFRVVARDEAGEVDATPAERSFTVDLTALAVTSHWPNGTVNEAVCGIEVNFSEPATGFGPGDVSLTGPSGAIAVTEVVDVGGADVFEFRFACQYADGEYAFTVGPDIYDLAGNPMAEAYAGGFTMALPDLAPTLLDIPTNGVAGEQIAVRWVVENRAATPAGGSWKDGIYLSEDAVWGDDILLGEFTFSGGLAAGADYDRTQNVTVPQMLEGTYWVLVMTDARGDVSEQNEGDDNRMVSAGTIEIVLPPYPDLQIVEVTGPPSAWPGQQVTVCWTVTNAGGGASGDVLWKDRVFFSTDHVIDLPFWNQFGIYDPGDPLLREVENPSSLAPGDSYQQCQSVTIPEDAVGGYFFMVRADGLNQLQEHQPGEDAEANNDGGTIAECVVSPPPPADLRVTSVNAPVSGWSGDQATISWEVTNVGDSPTPASFWIDAVYLSVDETLDSSDRRINTFGHNGVLPPGGSYTRTESCDLPRWFQGDYYVIVLTDSSNHVEEQGWEGNNAGYDATPLGINLTLPPDLEVTELTVSEVRAIRMTFSVDWTVTNMTASPTGASQWKDAIYLSDDDSMDTTADNVRVGGPYNHSGELGAFEFYSRSVTITLPPCIDGTMYLFVVTDVDDQVEEFFADYEDNNDNAFEPISVTTIEPDLSIDKVEAPPAGASGQYIDVGWEVTNIGAGATEASSYIDRVYLSADQTLDTSDGSSDRVLGSFTREGSLDASAMYAESRSVRLPVGVTGSFFVFVRTAADGAVEECGATANNTDYDAGGIFIAFTEADLVVDSVTVPSIAMSGQPMSIEWSVQNVGNRATDESAWSDAVYLSSDATLNKSADALLGNFGHTGALDSAEVYINSNSVMLPAGTVGTNYVFVCTDSGEDVVEPGQEGNNCTMSLPVEVVLTEPDLAVTMVSGPVSGSSGDQIVVEWTVENAGERVTSQGSWKDTIYLSVDTVFSAQADTKLGTMTHNGALDVGESYTAGKTVTLSAGGAGPHYLLVKTDSDNVVNEAGREANNVGYDADGIEVTCIEADLVVSSVSGPGTGDAGWPIEVSWTVSNLGSRATSASSWVDAVYLSDDPDFDAGDTRLGLFSRSEKLDPAGIYTRTVDLTLPDDAGGVLYLFVVTDDDDDVEECSDEGNNISAPPLTVTVGTTEIDLQVQGVNGPTQAYAGQEITVGWSVINAGTSATPNKPWRDSVYLSLDLFVDPEADAFIGFVVRNSPLGPGVSYSQNHAFTVPASLEPGDYHVLVVTDSTDELYEHEAEDNNVGSAAETVAVGEPLQADLVVTDIVVPLTATPGQQATFAWTVANQGANAALGSWYDSVYLSADETWDLSDALVAKVKHTGTVAAAGGSYSVSKTALVPGVVPVPQYVIVRCDINDQIPEGLAGEANNIGVSVETVDIQIIELELGVPFDTQLASSGMAHYYVVYVPAEETLRVELDADSVLGANELYIRYGQVPDRGHFDDAHDSPFLPDQEVTIPTTKAGAYYILVYGDWVPSPPQSYTILAESLPFSISDVIPDTGSNTSTVTVEILGARFRNDTEFSLIASDDAELTPTVTYPRTQSTAYATFNLTDVTVGTADMLAVNPDGSEAVGVDMFEVVGGGGPQLIGRLIAPSRVRAGRPFPVRIEYANIGNADMVAPVLELTSTEPVPMDLDPDGDYSELGGVRFLGVNQSGPAGILPQGSFGIITVHVSVPDTGAWAHRFLHLGLGRRADGSPEVDWAAQRVWADQYVRPAEYDDEFWNFVWDKLTERVGATWGEYEQEMARVATRVWQKSGRHVHDLRELFRKEIEFSSVELLEGSPPSHVSGSVVYAETGDRLVGAAVAAWVPTAMFDSNGVPLEQFASNNQADLVVTDGFGEFELSVSPGTYELLVDGYFVVPPVMVTVAEDEDLRGVVVSVITQEEVFDISPDEPVVIPDSSPVLARDADGNVQMVFHRGESVWHAVFDGAAWETSGEAIDSNGSDLALAPGPAVSGGDSVTLSWREGLENDSELRYAVGKPAVGTNGYEWSDPVLVTNDTVADLAPALLVTDSGEMMLVWLKRDASISDDTDLYYDFGPLAEPKWSAGGAGGGRFELVVDDRLSAPAGGGRLGEGLSGTGSLPWGTRDDTECVEVIFGPATNISLPFVGGKYGFEAHLKYCNRLQGCEFLREITASGGIFLKDRGGDLKGGGHQQWEVDEQNCVWKFNGGSSSYSAGASVKIGPVPLAFTAGIVKVKGSIGGRGSSRQWYGADGSMTKVSASLYAKGSIQPYIGAAGLEAGGVVTVYLPRIVYDSTQGWSWTGACVTGEIYVQVGHVRESMKWEVPTGCDPGPTLKPRDNAVVIWESDKGEVSTLEYAPVVGTGAVYAGQTVLSGVGGDLTADESPSLAALSGGEVLLAWSKGSDGVVGNIGSAIKVTSFGGSFWDTPDEVVDDTHFNTDPKIVVDSTDTPMLVWSQADSLGLKPDSPVLDIMDAMQESDLVYSRRVAGSWTAPTTMDTLPGTDGNVSLAADGAGGIVAAWLHLDRYSRNPSDVTVSVYASLWDGAAWQTPVVLGDATGATTVQCAYHQNTPVVVWAADVDGDVESTPLDSSIFHSVYDGGWSAPAALSNYEPAGKSKAAEKSGDLRAGIPFQVDPPEECCWECQPGVRACYREGGAGECGDIKCVNVAPSGDPVYKCKLQEFSEGYCDVLHDDEFCTKYSCETYVDPSDYQVRMRCEEDPDAEVCTPPEQCDESNDRCVECFTDGDCTMPVPACAGDVHCNTSTGKCEFTDLDHESCTSDPCDGERRCDPASPEADGSGCVDVRPACPENSTCVVENDQAVCKCDPGDPNACNDGVDCTDDECVGGECQNTANDSNCYDDFDFCNGDEVCDAQQGCVHTGNPCPAGWSCAFGKCHECAVPSDAPGNGCSDGVSCTKDECIYTSDGNRCRHTPHNDWCCTSACRGSEVCDEEQGCVRTADPTPCENGDCVYRTCTCNEGCRERRMLDCDDGPEPITSNDPNEKIGPSGYGAEGWIPVGENQMYTILFENKPEAAAAAQVVYVSDKLSENLDWRGFRVGNIGWGDVVVEVPENRSFFQADVPYANSNGYLVRVDAGINIQTGEVKWTLTTIDPATGEVPSDADAGFLPPNDPDTHTGEGFVMFTVRPDRDVPTGTVVENAATIVFDVNEPIDTNEVFNTIDADPPTSEILSLPDEVPLGFEVEWTGEDVEGGSGMGTYDIYVSEDGGPFTLWISTDEKSAVYTSTRNGAEVAFYSVARDNAGNMEKAPTVADAETLSFDNTKATVLTNSPVCEGDTIALYGWPGGTIGGPYTYSWSGPNGFSSDERNPTIPDADPDMAGAYGLTVVNGSGVEMADTSGVEVLPLPTVDPGSTGPVCPGESVALSGAVYNGGAVLWTTAGDGGFDNAASLDTFYTPGPEDITAGMVTLTLTAGSVAPCEASVGETVTVTVYPCATVNVEIGGLGGGEVERPVTFALTDCDGATETRVETMTFSPSGSTGWHALTLRGVQADAEWLSVQEGHTLRTLVPLDLGSDRTDTVTVVLRPGDFHSDTQAQDNYVDVTDFAILAANWEMPIDPNQSSGGDATGDGYQDAADFAAMQPYFYEFGDSVDGCPRGGLRDGPDVELTPSFSVRVDQLGLDVRRVHQADLDGNGVIDVRDIRAFAAEHGLLLDADFEGKLRSMEMATETDTRAPVDGGTPRG